VAHLETAEQARIAVDAALFPPLGSRSFVATSVQTLFRPGKAAEMMPRLNAEILIIGVIESVAALENVEAIAAVPGLDVLLVGTNNLSNSMGLFGQLDHALALAAYARVAAACKAQDKHLGVGGLAWRPDIARSLITWLGATYATAGSDAAFLLNGSTAACMAFR
jgi:2-keto-3-deoxy-L-rhamnonate aldolase RhmA